MRDDERILQELEYLTAEIKALRHVTNRQFELVERLLWFLINQNHFTILITQEGNPMAIGSLSSPGTATLLLTLLANGSPFVPPAGSPYVFSPSLTADDTNVTIAADPSTPNQFNVTIPAGDPSTSVTFAATAADPNGGTATGTLTIPFAAQPQSFTIEIQQTA